MCKGEPSQPDFIVNYYGYKDGEIDFNEDYKSYEAELDIWEKMGASL